MAAPAPPPTLLTTLTSSLTSASTSLPTPTTLTPPPDGISLLDTKNELLLSYLHTLLFHILTKLRHHHSPTLPPSETQGAPAADAISRKLIELRLYIEKGIRPLESRLQYQITKLLQTASDAAIPSVAPSASANDQTPAPSTIPELSHRPNPSAFPRPTAPEPTAIYRPPRITPTALPTTERREKVTRARKSGVLDAFIREEMGDGPVAEASIGAGSGVGGGKREREREEERRGYEEMRLVRLPGEKKKKGKGKGRRRGVVDELEEGGVDGFGGFDFGGLGGGGKRKRGGEGEGERDGEEGARVGEMWEKRARRGVGRKKKR